MIEFDSDYYIRFTVNGKNWLKRAIKVASRIPKDDKLHPQWFSNRGWDVPAECITMANNSMKPEQ